MRHIASMNEARWRQYLTDKERKRLAVIEAALAKSDALQAEKRTIANRAAQRARYDEAKAQRRNPHKTGES